MIRPHHDARPARPPHRHRATGCSPLAGALALAVLSACQPSPSAAGPAPADVAGTAATRAPTAPPLAPAALEPAQVQSIVDGLLRSAYGADSFDASRGCWRHTFETGEEPQAYCMRVAEPRVVAGEQGPQVYVLTYSDPDAGLYSRVDPGLQGVFAAQAGADGTWTPLASSPAIDMGQNGDCGCRDSELIQVGPDRHGWLSVAGGVWQGVESSLYALQVPIDGAFRNVSRIPRASEDAPGEVNILGVDRNRAVVAGMYPLTVTRRRGDTLLDSRTVAFDPVQGAYPWTP
ncbi:hypothetical protein [Luteimonas huabeiensis]|uniref:hypothetical protein n=1 Tax=Luteimonas huabeiensis TaxID=1244513 RepID=UPI001F260939|nr:hypothetical protein [Luteimonas huabeiensis]